MRSGKTKKLKRLFSLFEVVIDFVGLTVFMKNLNICFLKTAIFEKTTA